MARKKKASQVADNVKIAFNVDREVARLSLLSPLREPGPRRDIDVFMCCRAGPNSRRNIRLLMCAAGAQAAVPTSMC